VVLNTVAEHLLQSQQMLCPFSEQQHFAPFQIPVRTRLSIFPCLLPRAFPKSSAVHEEDAVEGFHLVDPDENVDCTGICLLILSIVQIRQSTVVKNL
jgi:hypothetical protein